jgi:hypothetical protein
VPTNPVAPTTAIFIIQMGKNITTMMKYSRPMDFKNTIFSSIQI